jgi:hypothetical protein
LLTTNPGDCTRFAQFFVVVTCELIECNDTRGFKRHVSIAISRETLRPPNSSIGESSETHGSFR